MVPCYVSGKGMYATVTTWAFKTAVIEALESSLLGYDTRYRYYRMQFPDMDALELARQICDPIEYYDKDWPAYRTGDGAGLPPVEAATRFMLERDRLFRTEAQAAIYCFDEAGFGSGVNVMRFLDAGKPLLGFYNSELKDDNVNVSNILQLALDFPHLTTLHEYSSIEEIPEQVILWLRHTFPTGAKVRTLHPT
jgi:hypothetical protein